MFNRILIVAALALAGCGAAVEDIAPDLDTPPAPIDGVTVAPKVCEPLIVVPGEPHVSCKFDAKGTTTTVHVVFKTEPSTIGASFCNELHECYPIEVTPALNAAAKDVEARWVAPRHLSLTLTTGDAHHWYAVVWIKE